MLQGRIFKISCRADLLTATVVGVLGFILVVGPAVLDVTNILWLTTVSDTTTHYLGWAFFRNDVWRWPLGLNPLYGLEFSSSLIFSDSIPLLAIPFKAIESLLPKVFQYSGLWLFLCFLLQAYFSVRLFSLVTTCPWVKAFAAVLMVFAPPFLWRLGGHFSLFAHWLILAALLIYLSDNKENLTRKFKWGALLSCATMVHTYLFAMITVIWIADLYQRNRRYNTLMKARWPEIIGVLGAAIFALWVAGFFPLKSTYLSGGYGIHRFNVLSLINPQGVPGDHDLWSYFLPALPQGEGDYEGFNYLGLGGVILVGLSLPLLWMRRQELLSVRMKPLLFAALFLTLFAITNRVGIGNFDIAIWLPERVIKYANIMRASGRFFWPVFYLILLGSVGLLVKQFGAKVTAALLACLAGLQIYDTQAGWGNFHEKFHLSASEWNNRLLNPDMDTLAQHYARLRALPAANAIHGWDTYAYLALRNHLPTDITYLARANDPQYAAAAEKANTAIKEGLLERDSLYLLDAPFAKRVSAVMQKTDALFVLGDVYIYAPNWLNYKTPVALQSADFVSH